jgi:hypothetical protein
MVISRFTTFSSAGVAVLAAMVLASPASASDRAECTASQMDTARRMLRAECPTSVTASASVFCAWYGAVELSNVECG